MKPLTKHEKVTMKLLCTGARFKVIAAELGVTHSVIVNRVRRVRTKLEAKNCCHACFLIGADRGLVE